MLITSEELHSAQCEVVWVSVCYSLAVFSVMEEREESDPGKVSDSLLLGGDVLPLCVQCNGCVDWYWTDLGKQRVLFLVGRNLAFQAKVEISQPVFPVGVGRVLPGHRPRGGDVEGRGGDFKSPFHFLHHLPRRP